MLYSAKPIREDTVSGVFFALLVDMAVRKWRGCWVSSRSITNHMLAHPGETFDIAPFVDGRCKTPIEEI